MKTRLIAAIVCIFMASTMSAQRLSGASLLEVMKKSTPEVVDSFVKAKGYNFLGSDYGDSFFCVWGSNLLEYSTYDSVPADGSKPMYVIIVNFTSEHGSPFRIKYRTSNLQNMRAILAYFKKAGYKKAGYDYAGGEVYKKSGSKNAIHYHERGRTIVITSSEYE
mgnify:FL=1